MEPVQPNLILPRQVAELIRSRQTFKVLADLENPVQISAQSAQRNDDLVRQAVADAGWAPFHYHRDVAGIAEPWRVYLIWNSDCRQIAAKLPTWFDDVKPNNKLPAMLSACGALVLITWLPQFQNSPTVAVERDSPPEGSTKQSTETVAKQIAVDEEHLAATAAMVQNLLLMLTAHQMGTYWSSGGQFRTAKMRDRLGIDLNEKLLAAVFVEYPETQSLPLERLAGKQREHRSPATHWCRDIKL